MRQCPIDSTQLKEISLHGIKVDRCPKDGGLFFDKEELRRAKDATDESLRWLDFDLFEERDNKYTKYNTDKKCPKDGSEMISLKYMDSGVRIEKCIMCDAVWLDRGEFERIISYLEKKIDTASSKDLGQDTIKELLEVGVGKESVGEEVKDFLSVLKLYELRLEADHPQAEKWIRNLVAYWPIH